MKFPADVGLLVMLAGLIGPSMELRPQDAPPPKPWTLALRVSGGIAGFDREIHLASTGAFTATDHRRRVSTMGSMPAVPLADLDAIISKLSASASRRDPGCRDCLVYRFEITRVTAVLTAEFDDLSVAGTPFEALAKTLTTQLTDALRQ